MRKECGRVEQAHLLVVECGAEEHAASDVAPPRGDQHCRCKRRTEADAVVLEVAVVDEHRARVEQQCREHKQVRAAGIIASALCCSATTQRDGSEQRCGEKGHQVREDDGPAQQRL